MNERIQELYMQAIQYADSVVPAERRYNDIYYAIASAKHAELIVRECIEHLESSVAVPNIEHSRTKTKCIRSIKEHFGVEE